jgi:hypothetical protein
MPNLLDTIKSGNLNLSQPEPKINPLMESQTAQLGAQLQKASGKAVSSTVPTNVNLGERVAQAKAMEDEAKVVQEAGRQESQLQQQAQAQEAEAQFQGRQLNEQALNMRQQMQQKAESILTEFTQGKTKLEGQRAQAKAEVASFLMRLSNEKYVNQLKTEGTKSRLQSETKFNEELQRSIWADEIDLLNGDLGFKRALRADERVFEKEMAEMSLDTAIALASSANQAAGMTQMFTGLGGLASAGIKGYSTWEAQQAAADKEVTTGLQTDATNRLENNTTVPRQGEVAPVTSDRML